jgi:hypothetical protein
MRAQAKAKIVALFQELGYDLNIDSTYDEIKNALSMALTGYGKFGPVHDPEPIPQEAQVSAVGKLGFILWRLSKGMGFSGSQGLIAVSDMVADAIDERIEIALENERLE